MIRESEKSTLLLQMCRLVSAEGTKVLYVSGEESARQIKLRAERIGKFTDDLYLFSETCIGTILQAVDEVKPEVLIVDSIQTVFEESGCGTRQCKPGARNYFDTFAAGKKSKYYDFLLLVM